MFGRIKDWRRIAISRITSNRVDARILMGPDRSLGVWLRRVGHRGTMFVSGGAVSSEIMLDGLVLHVGGTLGTEGSDMRAAGSAAFNGAITAMH